MLIELILFISWSVCEWWWLSQNWIECIVKMDCISKNGSIIMMIYIGLKSVIFFVWLMIMIKPWFFHSFQTQLTVMMNDEWYCHLKLANFFSKWNIFLDWRLLMKLSTTCFAVFVCVLDCCLISIVDRPYWSRSINQSWIDWSCNIV